MYCLLKTSILISSDAFDWPLSEQSPCRERKCNRRLDAYLTTCRCPGRPFSSSLVMLLSSSKDLIAADPQLQTMWDLKVFVDTGRTGISTSTGYMIEGSLPGLAWTGAGWCETGLDRADLSGGWRHGEWLRMVDYGDMGWTRLQVCSLWAWNKGHGEWCTWVVACVTKRHVTPAMTQAW